MLDPTRTHFTIKSTLVDDPRILQVFLEVIAFSGNKEVYLQTRDGDGAGEQRKGSIRAHLGEDDEFFAGQVQFLNGVPQDGLGLTVRIYLWRWIRKNSIYVAYASQLVLTLAASNTVIPWP